MRLRIENFRCYRSKEVVTSDTGVLLLSGQSGKGKSTLLNAIQFVITGEGKNVFSFGTSRCKVELDIGELHVCRTRRPNRLTVTFDGKTVEDDEAQTIINKCFGAYFSQSSYIMQGNLNTFLYMSPTEKLEFFEQFVFKTLDLNEKKDRLKELIKERSTALTSSRAKAETISKLLDGREEPLKPIFPIKCSKEDRDVLKSKYERLAQTKFETLSKLQMDLKHAIDRQNRNARYQQERLRCEGLVASLRQQLEHTRQDLNSLPDTVITFDLDELSTRLSAYREIHMLQSGLPSNKEVKNLEDKIAELTAKAWTDGSAVELDEHISNYKTMIGDVERYNQATARLAELPEPVDLEHLRTKIRNLELFSKRLVCPCCQNALTYDGYVLNRIVVGSDDPRELKNLRNRLKEAEIAETERSKLQAVVNMVKEGYEELHSVNDLNAWLTDAVEYVATNKKNDQIIAQLRDQLRRHKQAMDSPRLAALLQKYPVDGDIQKHINTLNDLVISCTVEKRQHEANVQKRSALQGRIDSLQKELNQVEGTLASMDIVDEGPSPAEIHQDLERVRGDHTKVTEILAKMEQYERQKQEVKQYKELHRTLQEANETVTLMEEMLKSVYLLKDKMAVAEAVYLERMLGELNEKLQDNINMFFVEEPMVVALETFKPSKDKKESKPQINVDVFYKGVEMDVMQLSGGERDRVNLAIVLALNELFESPILLLDECISSLDYANFNRVIDSLQDTMKDKLVMLVCHQAEEGQFDEVVEI